MPAAHTDTGSRLIRGLRAGTASVLALLLLILAPASSAAPTREEIRDAEARIQTMHRELGLLVEEYDQTQVALEQAQQHLGELRAIIDQSRTTQHRVDGRLANAAREAYKNQASNLGLILSSDSFATLSDRLYYLDAAAQEQADLAIRARVAQEQAQRAAEEVQRAVAQQRALLDRLGQQRGAIEQGITEQQQLVERLEDELQQQLIEQRQQAAQAAAASAPQPPEVTNPPPISGSGAAAAIAAAESVLGVPYVYGGASPQSGFDCSGLTMWAWAHAGVSLPHSSQMQYSSLPHVSKDQLQPGDLVFFYSPISHVGLYVGGGSMIHAPHTGAVVSRVAVYWEYFTGAARPG
jgi:cell wall-associated NlpC family hydrolase